MQAKKHLWQNFLKNTKILDMIVWEVSLQNKNIIEVWPWHGDLTAALLKKTPKTLTLIEIDDDMLPILEQRFSHESVAVYHNDVLGMDIQYRTDTKTFPAWFFSKEKVIYTSEYIVYGNIPYYITSPIIHHFLYDVSLRPQVAVFTMQKEVAERILARDGKQSVLSLCCQLVADVIKICDISPNNFTPIPKVWSTCLKFILRDDVYRDSSQLVSFIKKGFSQKRKQLMSHLTQFGYKREKLREIFQKIHISENIRPEDLILSQWQQLFERLR